MFRYVLFLLAATLLAACSGPPVRGPDKLVLQPIAFKDIPAWTDDTQNEALSAFFKSCEGFAAMKDTDATGQGDLLAPVTVWKSVCRDAAIVPAGDAATARQFFEKSFVPLLATNNGNPATLFTGYYEPLLKGSRTQHRPYVYPIYGLPPEGTPSYTRSQIDLGILNGHAPVIAYVDDPVQRFFLHVQGSGRIELDSGGVLNVGYAGSNKQPYVAIGKVLADKGILKRGEVTLPHLRQWLYDHPGDMWQVMWENTSYIFFRELKGDAVGTEQVPLTAGRSLAVDQRFIPLGMPVFINTIFPTTPLSSMQVLRRLMVAQDTGSAIKGPAHADIFFGFGEAAEQLAGQMKEGGEMILLVPRALAVTLIKPPS